MVLPTDIIMVPSQYVIYKGLSEFQVSFTESHSIQNEEY